MLTGSGADTLAHLVGKSTRTFRLSLAATAIAWSPDGQRLLLSGSRKALPSELYSVDSNGHLLVRLTSQFGSIEGTSWQ
jgi:Tol biopolymer transport system component